MHMNEPHCSEELFACAAYQNIPAFSSPLYGENETCVVPQPETLHSQQGLARHAEKDSLIPFQMNGFPTEMSL